jgi:hypothetical protein
MDNNFEMFAKEVEKCMIASFEIPTEIVQEKFSKGYSDLALYDLTAYNSFRRALWQALPLG